MTSKNTIYALIMAGGSGTRFWPESTRNRPKQYLSLASSSNKSLLAETLERISSIVSYQDRFIVTVKKQQELAHSCGKNLLPENNLIIEPSARNTAPCVFLSLLSLISGGASLDDLIIILPSDHVIINTQKFIETIKVACNFAEEHPHIVTIGVPPSFPHTGYGYIRPGKEITAAIREVLAFKEKPNFSLAEEYLKLGYLWNAGMFVGRIRCFLEEFKQNSPETYCHYQNLMNSLNNKSDFPQIALAYQEIPTNSLDYAVMEKSPHIAVVVASFDWNDLGSWDALYSLHKDKYEVNESTIAVSNSTSSSCVNDGNVLIERNPHYLFENAHNNLVKTKSEQLVVLSGVDDLLVINNDNTLLITPMREAQKIKNIVNKLEQSEWGKDYC